MVRVCEFNIIFLCVRSSIHLSVMLSPRKPLGKQTCYITSSPDKGVREQHHFSMRPFICPSRYLLLNQRYLLLNHCVEFNQTCYMTPPPPTTWKGCAKASPSVSPSIHPSVSHAISNISNTRGDFRFLL